LCWCCASPELLLQTTKAEIETYSLAGTLKDTIDFSDKEKEEQAIVTRSIADTLASFKELKKVSFKTKVMANGTLNHLLTHIQAKKKRKLHWHKMALALHPTPAVGGFPKQPAIDFIQRKRTLRPQFLQWLFRGNQKRECQALCEFEMYGSHEIATHFLCRLWHHSRFRPEKRVDGNKS
jgi:isochorismate synthase EntC